MNYSTSLLVALFISLFSPALLAAQLSGTITDENGTTLEAGAIQVRLWAPTEKGFQIEYEALTTAGGVFTFEGVATGNYRLNARMAPGFSGHYGDTWYDVEVPTSEGVFASDADLIEVESGDIITGLDISLPFTGGFHGRIVGPNGSLGGVWVRAESTTDRRYHHNDLTKGYHPRFGEYSFRGLRNSHQFRILVYDPRGRFLTYVGEASQGIVNGTDPNLGDLILIPTPADPNEPNNTFSDATSVTALPFETQGAAIFPRGEDVDWYCLEADAGDRFLARAEATIEIDVETYDHPWMDPILSFWGDDGSNLISWNDDAPGENTRSAWIDTGLLPQGGTYCFVVSTYGDQNWTGLGQQTAGPYGFHVEMGNRRPSLEVQLDGAPLPTQITTAEGEELNFSISYGDPDGDPVEPEVVHLGNDGQSYLQTLSAADGEGSYIWSVSQTAAHASPYTITFLVDDGEFQEEVTLTVVVEAVNLPPSTPLQIWPLQGIRVGSAEVELRIENSIDPDDDVLVYEFELHYGNVEGTPDQAGVIDEMEDGETLFLTAPIPENTVVSWRVRAFDGNAENGYSPWTDWEIFMVDTVNLPPSAPQIAKPQENELVLFRTPRIAATRPIDPEGDEMMVYFVIATDADFDDIFNESEAVAVSDGGDTVEWTVTRPLDEGTRYYVRAWAEDNRGGLSEYSATRTFRVRPAEEALPPSYDDSMAPFCFDGEPWTSDLQEIVIANIDQSGDALSFEVRISLHDDVLFETTVDQSDGETTTVELPSNLFSQEGNYNVEIRTIQGDESSAWISCNLFSPGSNHGGNGGGDGGGNGDDDTYQGGEAGCGCAATPRGGNTLLVIMALGFFFILRRRN